MEENNLTEINDNSLEKPKKRVMSEAQKEALKKKIAHTRIKQYNPILPIVRCFGRGPEGIEFISL